MTASEWTVGRAGMLYRNLAPDRTDVLISHIRIPTEGDVGDWVHFHRVDFQIILCVRGWIRVVYEEQGEPFWFGPGDLILQPPTIRHQVLECEAGSEVVEVCAPVEHTTHADPDTALPSGPREREWHGQRFLCDRAIHGLADRSTAIEEATGGAYRVAIVDRHLIVEPLDLRIPLPSEVGG